VDNVLCLDGYFMNTKLGKWNRQCKQCVVSNGPELLTVSRWNHVRCWSAYRCSFMLCCWSSWCPDTWGYQTLELSAVQGGEWTIWVTSEGLRLRLRKDIGYIGYRGYSTPERSRATVLSVNNEMSNDDLPGSSKHHGRRPRTASESSTNAVHSNSACPCSCWHSCHCASPICVSVIVEQEGSGPGHLAWLALLKCTEKLANGASLRLGL